MARERVIIPSGKFRLVRKRGGEWVWRPVSG